MDSGVAQWSIPKLEICGSNPVIGKNLFPIDSEMTTIKRKEAELKE